LFCNQPIPPSVNFEFVFIFFEYDMATNPSEPNRKTSQTRLC
jgi:hypothetical protein